MHDANRIEMQSTAPTKIRILSKLTPADEILNMEYHKPEFIIEELISTGLVLICGRPKVGKSWFVLRMCIDIVSGSNFLGKFKANYTKVAYFALEDNIGRLQERLKEMQGEADISGILISNVVRAFDEKGSEEFENLITQHKNIKLWIIDTMQKAKPLMRNKSFDIYGEEYGFAGKLQSLALKYNITIAFVHHGRKNNAGNEFIDDVLGSTGLAGAADTIIMLSRDKDDSNTISLQVAGRDVERRSLSYDIDSETMQFNVIEDDGGGAKLKNAALQEQIVNFLEINAGKHFSPTEIATALCKTEKNSRGIVSKALGKLVDKEMVVSSAYGKYCFRRSENDNCGHGGHYGEKTQDSPSLKTVTSSVTTSAIPVTPVENTQTA
jgi:hypothetical protein